jgi:hypothetical protein
VYTSIDDALRQTVEITAGAKDEFDVGRNVVAGTVGTVAGAGLTAGASAAVPLVKNAF